MGSHRYAGPRHARPRGPRHARPLPPSAVHRTAAATGIAAAIVTGETMSFAGAAGAVTADDWARLRMCESSGNYATNTGNGYYGAYQFSLPTWSGMGYPGLPSAAAPAVQDAAAQRLYDARGWQPWPACSAKLGLVDDRTASRGDTRPPLTPPTPTPAPTPAPSSGPTQPGTPGSTPVTPAPQPVTTPAPVTPTSMPKLAWDGHYLTVRDVRQSRPDVTAWQQQMVVAGYHVAVDGRYGPQSAAAASQFEADHHLSVEHPGVVGPQIWGALFSK